jgi:hypothetical protein
VPAAAPAAAPEYDAAVVPAPAPGGTQIAGQSAENTQTADADADATQIAPTNESIAVRIGSKGDNGEVRQANDAIALAGALNANKTTQDVGQSQAGGGGKQVAGQSADSDQSAHADADADQKHPTNVNISVRIFSPGDDGPVSQSNTAVAGALAGNGNATSQTAAQSQGGGSGGGSQVAGQKAENDQVAHADADATQVHPKNQNISVRIFSPGDNGPVSQSNTVAAGALAANGNHTTQSVTQSQAGGTQPQPCSKTAHACAAPGGSAAQIAGQSATNTQCACADATATQIAPSNENHSIRVGSPGADGPVSQSNGTLALAGALNGNATSQTIGQSQGVSGGTGVQAAGQKAESDQHATADADAYQVHPSNVNAPVRVGSKGDGGSVEQTNAVLVGALAANLNGTKQDVRQDQAGGGTAVQAAGQHADNDQSADADAKGVQCCASNVNAPARVLAWGEDGPVRQSNVIGALAVGLNLNHTGQAITQSQGGSGGTAVQAAGQKAANDQDADADAHAFQIGARNVNAPIAVLGGHDPCGKQSRCDRDTRCKRDSGCHGDEPWKRDGHGCKGDDGRKRHDPCTQDKPRKHDDGRCEHDRGWKHDDPCKGEEPRKGDEPWKGDGGCMHDLRAPSFDGCRPHDPCDGYDRCAPKPERPHSGDRCTKDGGSYRPSPCHKPEARDLPAPKGAMP